jgi:hypothetical protein
LGWSDVRTDRHFDEQFCDDRFSPLSNGNRPVAIAVGGTMRNEAEDNLKPLSSFTPRVEGIDRDAILFAAGRQSARSSWKWKIATSLLATTQAATLALWLNPVPTFDRTGQTAPTPSQFVENSSPTPSPSIAPNSKADPNSFLVLHRLAEEGEWPRPETIEAVKSETPLTMHSSPETIQ